MRAYRHLFHAGGFSDVFKHALLAQLVLALRNKVKPFFYLDTHAGTGRYDLTHPKPRVRRACRNLSKTSSTSFSNAAFLPTACLAGAARAECGREKRVAFSCKRRGICPSCGARRMAETAAWLVDRVIPKVPVLSLPIPARSLLASVYEL